VNDVAAGVVEENVALAIAADGDEPFQLVAIFQEIVDRLVGSLARDDGDLGVGGLLRLGARLRTCRMAYRIKTPDLSSLPAQLFLRLLDGSAVRVRYVPTGSLFRVAGVERYYKVVRVCEVPLPAYPVEWHTLKRNLR
jgi:hypothetical protein